MSRLSRAETTSEGEDPRAGLRVRGFSSSGAGWERIFVSGGRVRAVWRILLFAVLFQAFLWLTRGVSDWLVPGREGLFRYGATTLLSALAAGWVLLAWLDRRSPGALGFAWTSGVAREVVGGLAVGAGSLGLVVAGLAAAGFLSYEADGGAAGEYVSTLLGSLFVLSASAAAEEALFRGYPFQVLVQGMGPVGATLLASAAFAVAHGANPHLGWFALLNLFLAGVLLSVAYLRTRSLWFATAVHLGWNWAMGGVLDLPVSGLELFDTPLYEPRELGPAWLTGGAFGPEGGLSGSLAVLVALAAVIGIPAFREAPEMRELEPLADRGREGDR